MPNIPNQHVRKFRGLNLLRLFATLGCDTMSHSRVYSKCYRNTWHVPAGTYAGVLATRCDEFKSLGVQVLSVSTDSRFTHKIWQEEELSKMVSGGVPYPMLSDAGGRIGAVYGVYDEEGRGRHSRPISD